jgi:hypothetical protein
MHAKSRTRILRAMARYKLTVVFKVHEEVEMKSVHQEQIDQDEAETRSLPYQASKRIEKSRPHINKLYEDIFERIEAAHQHPITYDIVSFDKLKDE